MTITHRQIDNDFTYHPPTDARTPRYSALMAGYINCMRTIDGVITDVRGGAWEGPGQSLLRDGFPFVADILKVFAKLIVDVAPSSPQQTLAIRHLEMARMMINEGFTNYLEGRPPTQVPEQRLYEEGLVLITAARMWAAAAIALNEAPVVAEAVPETAPVIPDPDADRDSELFPLFPTRKMSLRCGEAFYYAGKDRVLVTLGRYKPGFDEISAAQKAARALVGGRLLPIDTGPWRSHGGMWWVECTPVEPETPPEPLPDFQRGPSSAPTMTEKSIEARHLGEQEAEDLAWNPPPPRETCEWSGTVADRYDLLIRALLDAVKNQWSPGGIGSDMAKAEFEAYSAIRGRAGQIIRRRHGKYEGLAQASRDHELLKARYAGVYDAIAGREFKDYRHDPALQEQYEGDRKMAADLMRERIDREVSKDRDLRPPCGCDKTIPSRYFAAWDAIYGRPQSATSDGKFQSSYDEERKAAEDAVQWRIQHAIDQLGGLLVVDGGDGTDSPIPVVTIKKNLTFGAAIQLLRRGFRVRRAGWNGKNMWLALQVPDENSKMTLPYLYIEYPAGHIAYPNGSRVPWLASQTDMLCNDWEVVE